MGSITHTITHDKPPKPMFAGINEAIEVWCEEAGPRWGHTIDRNTVEWELSPSGSQASFELDEAPLHKVAEAQGLDLARFPILEAFAELKEADPIKAVVSIGKNKYDEHTLWVDCNVFHVHDFVENNSLAALLKITHIAMREIGYVIDKDNEPNLTQAGEYINIALDEAIPRLEKILAPKCRTEVASLLDAIKTADRNTKAEPAEPTEVYFNLDTLSFSPNP